MAGGAAGQDLAPEVLLLARIKNHLREEFAHLPNYTCLETIARFHKEAGGPAKRATRMQPLDTVRLEIVYSNGREWYGSPGGRRFSEDNPAAFIGAGMIGTGAFALTLNNIFLSGAATFTYRGEEPLMGRMAVRYDFRLPRLVAQFHISIVGGNGTVGEEGSFWTDPQSLDLLRLETRAAEIPPHLPLEAESMTMSYARTGIGESNVLLAQQADLHMVDTAGDENFDRFDFTHCRAFHVHSSIHFEPEATTPARASLPDPSKVLTAEAGAGETIPAFLRVTMQLATPISNSDAVGKLIDGRIAGDVYRKGKIVIRDGSVVRGRIRRLDQYQGGGYFIVGLEFTEVEANGGSLRFYADLLSIDKMPGIQLSLSEQVLISATGGLRTADRTVNLPELPGVASFFVRGTSFTIPSGFRMVWKTHGILR